MTDQAHARAATSLALLTVEATQAVVARVRAAPDAELRRLVTTLSLEAIASMAVLAHQLDAIAQAAAAYASGTPDLERYADLQERLVAAGYLPLPRPANKEASRGQA